MSSISLSNDDEYIVCGYIEGHIDVYSLSERQIVSKTIDPICKKVIQNIMEVNRKGDIILHEDKIITITENSLLILELKTLSLLKKIENCHDLGMTCIGRLDNNSIATASLDGVIKIWKLDSFETSYFF
jgi:hypothetical protein